MKAPPTESPMTSNGVDGGDGADVVLDVVLVVVDVVDVDVVVVDVLVVSQQS